MNYWILVANPDKWFCEKCNKNAKVNKRLKNLDKETWRVSEKNFKDAKIGDKCIIRISQDDRSKKRRTLEDGTIVDKLEAGVYALGKISKELYFDENTGDHRVEVEITNNLFKDSKIIDENMSLKILGKYQASSRLKDHNKFKEIEKLIKGDKIMSVNSVTTNQPLNQILYGPPGTGKTYHTINKALEIIDGKIPDNRKEAKKRFDELKESGQIEFITFHQSYGYEEFIEGLKAKTDDDNNIQYSVEAGVFKKLSDKARKNFENSIDLDKLIYDYATYVQKEIEAGNKIIIDNGDQKQKEAYIEGIKKKNDDEISSFIIGGIKEQSLSIKIIERDFENFLNNKISSFKDIKPSRTSKSISHGNAIYYLGLYKDLKKFMEGKKNKYLNNTQNYILIIDEINRGNISKIFGELITLIEPSKRIGADEEIRVQLPYSNESFGVPKNLYIIGTMNTADRSIALMDTALRRRFEFVEMMPKPEMLKDKDKIIDNINLKKLLETINKRIEYLYDRDHTIGHAYFIDIKDKEQLDNVMRNKVIPLLQEYFYDDWEKIQMVLGDHDGQKVDNADKFIKKIDLHEKDLFGFDHEDIEDKQAKYSINESFTEKAYTKIYQ